MKRVSQKRGKQQRKAASDKTGMIRIIAGQWRGRRLPVRDAEGLRPTTDRNKETLFNWLMHTVTDAHCLDMFAGSGGLGLEALSRYAASCEFFEYDKANATQLNNNLTALQANGRVRQGDALALITTPLRDTFDIIFIDPPFGHGLVQPALDALFRLNKVSDEGVIYIEQEAQAPRPDLPQGWEWLKQKTTSSLVYGLVGKASA